MISLWRMTRSLIFLRFLLIKGYPQHVKELISVVITEDMAQKYFGDEDPLGRVIKADNKFDYTVTGVMKNIPPNSHFIFNALFPSKPFVKSMKNYQEEKVEDWGVHDNYTYLLLREAYDYRESRKNPCVHRKICGRDVESTWRKS